jgi:hypothetical protein
MCDWCKCGNLLVICKKAQEKIPKTGNGIAGKEYDYACNSKADSSRIRQGCLSCLVIINFG